MRWIFFSLLGVNLIFLLWHGLSSDGGEGVVDATEEGVATIQLLSEVDLSSKTGLPQRQKKM